MQRITLPKILTCLETLQPEVKIAPEVAARARRPIERMLELSTRFRSQAAKATLD
jgi:quinolinate synthase